MATFPHTHTHTHTQRSCPDSVGSWLTLRKWKKCGEQKNTLTLPVYPRAPQRAQSAIHHICISICILTSHTYATVNKLPFVRKHAPRCTPRSWTRCVYTPTHNHHVVLTVCFFWTITSDAPLAQFSWAGLYLPLWCHRSIHFSKRWQIVSSLLICHPFPT